MEDRVQMRLVIDTNIFLEVILEQSKASEARVLLTKTEEHEFFLTDYSLHSIGLLLFRRQQHNVFQDFLDDMLVRAGMSVVSLAVEDMSALIQTAQQFNLDFDDSYQYVAAKNSDLKIVSFDRDFDRTERGKRLPTEI
jgi:uncharacterized protein